jgi:hypothetical protein
MAETYKILGQVATSDTTEKVLYTSPAGTQTLVTNITAVNRTNTAQTFDVNVYNSVKVDGDLEPGTNNRHIVSSSSSEIALYSSNGTTWNQATLPSSSAWYGMSYGNNTFVAIAYSSTKAASSTDGITWTERTLPSSAGWFSSTYGNNTFVAVATGSTTAASSTDGITWTLRTLPSTASWQPVTYGNNTFVATSYGSTSAASSTDGITWTLRTLPSTGGWRSVTYGAPAISPSTTNSEYMAYNNSIPGNSTVTIKAGYTLATGNGIRVTSTNGTSTFSTFGAEIS